MYDTAVDNDCPPRLDLWPGARSSQFIARWRSSGERMSSGDTEDVELNELNVPWRDTGPRRTNQLHLHEFNTCLHSFHVRLSTCLSCFYSASILLLLFF